MSLVDGDQSDENERGGIKYFSSIFGSVFKDRIERVIRNVELWKTSFEREEIFVAVVDDSDDAFGDTDIIRQESACIQIKVNAVSLLEYLVWILLLRILDERFVVQRLLDNIKFPVA